MNQLIERVAATSRIYGGRTKKGRAGQVMAAIGFANTGLGLYRSIKEEVNGKFFYTAEIPQDAYIYNEIMAFLNTQMKPGKHYIMNAEYRGVTRFYNGNATNKVEINGALFYFTVEKPDLDKMMGPKVIFEDEVSSKANKLIFRTRHKGNLQILEDFLSELTTKKNTRKRETYIWNPSGNTGWDAKVFRPRSMESIFLPRGVKEELEVDLDTFFEHEASYERLGVPYHRGYLFYGPPGNGKSSVAKAVASKYSLHLYNLPLSAVKDDSELMQRITSINPNSVLLLEDIDIFSKSMGREQADSGPTLAGLLNALDGVSTPHGLVTFMSTNKVEVLDEALIRPGRIDKRVHMVAPDRYQVEQMFSFAFDEPLGCEPREFSSMAELSGVFKMFTLDAESARMEIKAN